jgi:hypothetical protein
MKVPVIFLFISCFAPVYAAEAFVEAESFDNKGGWVTDQQFMDLMGSPYLMAHGMGCTVKDAVTPVVFPETGVYHAYVRTYNWTAPWFAGEGAGKFRLKVGNKTLPTVLGSRGNGWQWQKAGSVEIKTATTTLSLCDLTGFNGRCDAVYFTTDAARIPPSEKDALDVFRKKLLGIPGVPAETERYDLVVVGGGIAGMCAAASAGRLGCKVALVNDRPVWGGNNSSEVRVHLGGRIGVAPYENLGNLLAEFAPVQGGNAQAAAVYEDDKKSRFIASEKNITLFGNCRAISVRMAGDAIEAVTIKDVESGRERRLAAPVFADCTGDGTLGFLAGADFAMGREGRDQYGEAYAPLEADSMTMGASVQWYSSAERKPSAFPVFEYGVHFTENNCERTTMGEWKWETGMDLDPVNDAERIRDYGLLVVYANWSFLKNRRQPNDDYKNRRLDWVAYVAGKRESRRLLGDYILKQDDIQKNVFHEDRSVTTTWSIDLHFPDPEHVKKFPWPAFKAATVHRYIRPYAIPYRCLYSRNVSNLFMAGRNISVTHVALGTVRVMRTTGMMGEVVGMAASLCKKFAAKPRDIYRYHLAELKRLMEKGTGRKNLSNAQKYNEGSIIEN